MPQLITVLIGDKPEAPLETPLLDTISELLHLLAAADDQKDDARISFEFLSGRQHRIKFVGPAQVSRVADDELAVESPLPPQYIVTVADRRDLFIVAPVRDDVYAVRRHPPLHHLFRHQASKNYVGRRCSQRTISQGRQALTDRTSQKWNAELDGYLRKKVLQPVHELSAS